MQRMRRYTRRYIATSGTSLTVAAWSSMCAGIRTVLCAAYDGLAVSYSRYRPRYDLWGVVSRLPLYDVSMADVVQVVSVSPTELDTSGAPAEHTSYFTVLMLPVDLYSTDVSNLYKDKGIYATQKLHTILEVS